MLSLLCCLYLVVYLFKLLFTVFCEAWDIAVTLMEVGELAQLKTSARFAYGEVGKLPAIPGNADLTYELELMDVQPPLMLATINEKQLMEVV